MPPAISRMTFELMPDVQIINWLCTEGEDGLIRHASVADNLRAIETQYADLEKLHAAAQVGTHSHPFVFCGTGSKLLFFVHILYFLWYERQLRVVLFGSFRAISLLWRNSMAYVHEVVYMQLFFLLQRRPCCRGHVFELGLANPAGLDRVGCTVKVIKNAWLLSQPRQTHWAGLPTGYITCRLVRLN